LEKFPEVTSGDTSSYSPDALPVMQQTALEHYFFLVVVLRSCLLSITVIRRTLFTEIWR